MIGPKKLSTVRRELHEALRTVADDPILWLEKRMTAGVRPKLSTPNENQVLTSLRRVLEMSNKQNKRKRRVGSKS